MTDIREDGNVIRIGFPKRERLYFNITVTTLFADEQVVLFRLTITVGGKVTTHHTLIDCNG